MLLALPSRVGVRCGLLLLLSSHYSFCIAISVALFLCMTTPHTSIPLLVVHYIVRFSRATILLMLPLFSHCSFYALLLLSCCHSFRIALLASSFLLHFRCLLVSLCCYFHIAILVFLMLLLLCFACLIWYFPCTCHVQVEV
jgi:hypothetical protein